MSLFHILTVISNDNKKRIYFDSVQIQFALNYHTLLFKYKLK